MSDQGEASIPDMGVDVDPEAKLEGNRALPLGPRPQQGIR